MAATISPKRDTHAGRISRRSVVDGYMALSLSHRLLMLRWLGNWRASLTALKNLVKPGFESMAPAAVSLGIEPNRTFTGRPGSTRYTVLPFSCQD